ncbi:MAG: isocitrate/isopropylmalate dehydrogenase family protein [Thermoplasmata archaeon]|nr:isocitrate/isopropylmalate dehydrogenase family protein [Thermoplasmata archaeon]
MANYKIVLLPGDGIGPEVMKEAEKILDTISETGLAEFELVEVSCGYNYYSKTGTPWPEGTLERCKNDADAVLLGAVGDVNATTSVPRMERLTPGGKIVFGLRAGLELFANVRPVKLYPNIKQRISHEHHQVWQTENINLVIIRENSEGLYADVMAAARDDVPIQPLEIGERVEDSRVTTDNSARRIIELAFEHSLRRTDGAPIDNKKRVTCVDKSNVLIGCKLFRNIFREIAGRYTMVESDYAYIDAFVQWLLRKPEQYNIVVMSNIFGDIASDLAAVLQGGMGMAPSANIGTAHAMFEPVHGAAPKYTGQDRANPIGMILSVKMMLDWLGDRKNDDALFNAAKKLEEAVIEVLETGETMTPDIGGKAKCSEVGNAITGHLHDLLNESD